MPPQILSERKGRHDSRDGALVPACARILVAAGHDRRCLLHFIRPEQEVAAAPSCRGVDAIYVHVLAQLLRRLQGCTRIGAAEHSFDEALRHESL